MENPNTSPTWKIAFGLSLLGPSGETRTRGILVPNQAPYQLGHTRILSYEKMLVVVKYVVKEILPHFLRTFNGGICVCLRSNRGVSNIWSSRTVLVFQLPNQAPFLLRCPVNVLGHTAFVPHRPLPLARLPFSAPGGGRLAPQLGHTRIKQ